ncbi:MAG: hypothetical protein M2R45_04000 [Verrucomicrobia subdivision 3 bacterium]|nr:hypothetical protein [Limisphaerales bacterium]MCS1416249.1 hypothetical protein [Limisphaerales bacterium]
MDPYHLANINREWFLFAYCHLREGIRTFVPARITAAKDTGVTFKRPTKFSLDRRLRGSFGVHSGGGSYEVRIRFSEWVADYLREKQWHPSQKLKEHQNGEVEIQMQTHNSVKQAAISILKN